EERFVLNVTDQWARRWIRQDPNGRAWAEEMGFDDDQLTFVPNRECNSNDPRPLLAFSWPREGQTIEEDELEIRGLADATQIFDFWRLDYGEGREPVEWRTLMEDDRPVNPADI